MIEYTFDLITVLGCVVGYAIAFWLYRNDKPFKALAFLIACGLLLRVFVASDLYLHEWDERYHALVAKNMITQPFKPMLYDKALLPYDYRDWSANHIWLHKQPLPLWSMALSMKIFGVNEIALRLPSVLISTIGIALTFLLGMYLFDKKVAFIAAFLHSVNGLIIELTGGRVATDHVDVFFLFFVELAVVFTVLFARRRHIIYNLLTGAAIGAAVLCKWLPAFVVIPIWMIVVYNSGGFNRREMVTHFFVLMVTAVAVFLPWQIYIHSVFPLESFWEATMRFRHITHVLDEQGGGLLYYFDKIRMNYGELIYLPLAWFTWMSVRRKSYNDLVVVTWFWVPLLFFTFTKTKMQGYLVFTAPALFLLTAVFYHWLLSQKKSTGFKRFAVLLAVALLLLPVRYAWERVKPFKRITPAYVSELKKFSTGRMGQRAVLFNYPRAVEAMFYSDLIVYPFVPTVKTIDSLQKLNYTVLINERDEESLTQIFPTDVEIVKLSSAN